MGVVRALLPVLRLAAGAGLRPGPALLGAALRHCSSPRTWLIPPQPLASRLKWSGEAAALFRAPATGRRSAGGHRRRWPDRSCCGANCSVRRGGTRRRPPRWRTVAAAERSVALYRRAAERDPAAHEPELARTLAALSTHLLRTGSGDGSVSAAREALEITRRSAEPDGQEHRSRIAQRLRLLGRALHRTGDEEEAEACFTEAETILRTLMETGGRERYAADLDAALSGLAAALGAAVDVHFDADRAT